MTFETQRHGSSGCSINTELKSSTAWEMFMEKLSLCVVGTECLIDSAPGCESRVVTAFSAPQPRRPQAVGRRR